MKKRDRSQRFFIQHSEKVIEIIVFALSLIAGFFFNVVEWWVFLINAFIVVVGLLALYYLNNKNRINSINDEINELKSINSELKHTTELSDLLKYVCNSEQLMKIEGSVCENEFENHKIFVQSSKFQLETSNDDFFIMLIENLRKGVQYYYLIPKYQNSISYNSFYSMVISWWDEYSKFLYDKECCHTMASDQNNAWQKQYKKFVHLANKYWKKQTPKDEWNILIDNTFELFKERLFVYAAEESLFYIVTAIYQIEQNQWKAIVKLPTDYGDTDTNDYYSYLVFGEGCADSNNHFIKQFINNFADNNKFDTSDLYSQISKRVGEIKNEK